MSALTSEMLRVLRIAERDGMVVAGKGAHAGRVERVPAPTVLSLIRRGLLSHVYGPEGGVGGRLTEAGRAAIAPEKKTPAQLDAEIAEALASHRSRPTVTLSSAEQAALRAIVDRYDREMSEEKDPEFARRIAEAGVKAPDVSYSVLFGLEKSGLVKVLWPVGGGARWVKPTDLGRAEVRRS